MISTEEILRAVRPRLRLVVAKLGDAAIGLIQDYTADGTKDAPKKCEPETIGGWLALSMPPANKLIRLWHVLNLMGFPSSEMSELDDFAIMVGRLYALGIMEMSDLTELLKVSTQQTVIQFLRGQAPLHLRPKEAVKALREQHGEALAAAAAKLPKFEVVEARNELAPQTAGPAKSALSDPAAFFDAANAPLALAMIVGMAAPLTQVLVDGSPEERERFRGLVGQHHSATLQVVVEQLDALRTRAAFDDYRSRSRR